MKNLKYKFQNFFRYVLACLILIFNIVTVVVPAVHAQTPTIPADSENLKSSTFRLLICDGPPLPSSVPTPTNLGHTYVPCDFNGAMMQVQHLINIAIVGGVLVAIFGFSYAGFLYIRGREADRTQASSMFQKVFVGFIIMLSAWFIVYQILAWLTGGSAFGTLLGPKS